MYHKKPSKADFKKWAKENEKENKKQKPLKVQVGNKTITFFPVPLITNPKQLEKDWERDEKLRAELRRARFRGGIIRKKKSKPCRNAA